MIHATGKANLPVQDTKREISVLVTTVAVLLLLCLVSPSLATNFHIVAFTEASCSLGVLPPALGRVTNRPLTRRVRLESGRSEGN